MGIMHEEAFTQAFAFDVGGTYVDRGISEIDDDAEDVDGNDDEEIATISNKVSAFRFFIPIGLSADPAVWAFIQLLQMCHRGESLQLEEMHKEVSVHLSEPRESTPSRVSMRTLIGLADSSPQRREAGRGRCHPSRFHVLLLEKAGRIGRSQADKDKTCRIGLLLQCCQ